jgi:hypothetical protein
MKRCGLLLFALSVGGCGGNDRIPNTPSRSYTAYITLKADGGRTAVLGYRFEYEDVELETRLRVDVTVDSQVVAPGNPSGPSTIHLRGFDSSNTVIWTRDVLLTGVDGESVTVDPN